MHNTFLYICIGLINGLIFGTFAVIIIHYAILFNQASKMIETFVEPLNIFKDYITFNLVDKQKLKQFILKLINIDIPPTPQQLEPLQAQLLQLLTQLTNGTVNTPEQLSLLEQELRELLILLIDSNVATPEQLAELEKEAKEYQRRFNIFMIIIGVFAILSIIILSFIILKNNNVKYIMGNHMPKIIKVNSPGEILLEWFLEIIVTILLLVFIYMYFTYVVNKYIYGNIMKIFVPQ